MNFIKFLGIWLPIFATIVIYGFIEISYNFKVEIRWHLLLVWILVFAYYGGYLLYTL